MIPQSTWNLATRHLGREVRVFDAIDSTNTYALAFADDPALHGLVVLARSQSAGRGQYGRTWSAPPESSVLASLLVFPPPELRRPVVMIAWAAVAVCDVVQQLTGLEPTIKWPNDILVDSKKVCGFLIEQRTTGSPDLPLATVIGLGLNVTQSAADFAAANLPDAASLASLSGKRHAVEAVARAIIARMDQDYELLLNGDLAHLESQWQRRLALVDKSVIANLAGGPVAGQLLDIRFDGLTMHTDAGLIRLTPESIRHLRLNCSD